jgi:hypothetical protein
MTPKPALNTVSREAAKLSKNGIVDVAYPSLIQGAAFDTWLLGRKDYPGIR